jgi:hypothetical protein
MWIALFKRYWQVTIFKDTPANTPYSLLLLGVTAVLYYLMIILQWSIAADNKDITLTGSLFAGIALLLSYVIYTGVLLLVSHRAARFVQSLTCILAGHAIVHVLAFPLLLMTPLFLEAAANQSLGLLIGVIYLAFTLVLTVWQFMVTVHIFKHTLNVNYLAALFASLGLLASNVLIVSLWSG